MPTKFRNYVVAGCLGLIAALAGCSEPGPTPSDDATPPAGFRKVVLDDFVTRPHALEVAPDGRVFFIEREGAVKVWEPATRTTTMAGFIPVHAVHTSGLLGIALDPDFGENGWIYFYYSPHDATKNVLARFTLADGRLVPESRKVLLEVPVQRDVEGGHSGGALAFGPEGTLFLSTGDNTSPFGTAYAPLDERPGHEAANAQRSSGNTNDLRGKILRIRPLPDGSYEIPEGNLFPYGSLGRPEIYIMGARNPYRIAVDPETGWLYWGDIGPDANAPDPERGPAGYDEVNQAREAGNFGWPYFIADNRPYHPYDAAADTSGPAFDPVAPVNTSRLNTGARVLPPAKPALVWYPYPPSDRFPVLGTGGRAVMAGAVYRYDAGTVGSGALPAAYDGSLFIFEFMRNWIMQITFDEDGDLHRIEPFLPEMTFQRPMDMDVGPDGALYLIEWGASYEGWYNDAAQLVRIEYASDDAEASSITPPEDTSLAIEWPVHGGVFDFNAPIDYRLNGSDEIGKQVTVRPALAHDAHLHPMRTRTGSEGQFTIAADETHLYLEDQFAVLDVQAGGDPPLVVSREASPTRILLQPRRKQAEHATTSQGIERTFTGDNPEGSVLRYRQNVQGFVVAEDGNYASYAPVNLLNIDSLTFRVAPLAGGRIEVRLDAPDGPLLAEAGIEAGGGGWRTITVPVTDPGGVHELFLVFAGAPGEPLLRLDWLKFNGAGIMGRPDTAGATPTTELQAAEPAPPEAPSADQPAPTPASDGAQVYAAQCASCHQTGGEGIPELYPPLDESPWVTGDPDRLIRIALHGMQGEIVVKDVRYNGVMPAWGAALSNADVAAVLTYIRTAWRNDAPAVTAADVARVRAVTQDRTAPWTVEELNNGGSE